MRIMCLAATALTAIAPNVAHAQSNPSAPTAGSAPTSGIQDIVVTAQKREQRLQDVPVAISALSGSAVASKGVRTIDDLAAAVPAINFTKNLNGAPYIRGIGTRITTAGNLSSVATFVDGVLQISPLQGNFTLNDIDRIEVLKGPQGTLFGRNANGGVINIITHDPTQETRADASIGYANYDTVDAKLYASGGLGGNFAGNLSLNYHNQMDGWGKNINNGDDAYRERMFDVRSKLRWQDGTTDIVLTGEYHHLWSNADATAINAGTRGLDGSGSPGFYNINSDFKTYVATNVAEGSLRINHDLDWAKLVSITAYTHVKTRWPFDSDATPAFNLEGPIYEFAHGYTQELQLVSPSSNRKLKWILGLYYLNTSAGFTPIELHGAEVGNAKVEVFGTTGARSVAGFGEATYEFLPDTHLTLGGRMTFDHRDVTGHTDVNDAPGVVSNQSANFRKFTYRATLDTKPVSGLMLYGTISTGYNSGQFNTGDASAPAVKPETLKAYEVGFKSELLDHKLQINAAAYYYDYTNLQVTITQNAITLQTNAARAHVKGFELDGLAAPVHGLTLNANLAYTDAKYADYRNAQFYVPLATGGYAATVGDATGKYLILAPKWSVTLGAQYDIETASGTWTPSINFNHRSSFYWDYQDSFREKAHDLVNASLTFTLPSKRWSVQLWGKNLANQKIRAAGILRNEGALTTPAAPLTLGGTVSFHL